MNKKQLLKFCKKYAKENGLKLQPNKNILNIILEGLLRNEKKYGFRYCPCRVIPRSKEEAKKIICPCAYHLDEIKKQGHCLCKLFYKS